MMATAARLPLVLLLLLPAPAAQTDRPIAPHLRHMTFYTHPDPAQLSIMEGWITMANEQGSVEGAVSTYDNFSIPSLMGQLPWNPAVKGQLASPDALLRYSNAANRSRDEAGVLQPDWRGALGRWVAARRPLFANGSAAGVFVGDEMGCGGSRVGRANMTAVLREHSPPPSAPLPL